MDRAALVAQIRDHEYDGPRGPFELGWQKAITAVLSLLTAEPERPDAKCQACGVQTGGGEYCYEHKPYMVYPQQDGSYLVDRFGRRHVSNDLGEPERRVPEGQ